MNTRKPMALHTGHHTKAEMEQMRQENEAAETGRDIFESTPSDLIDKTAKREWRRITKELIDFGAIGNLDAANLIGYCNAYSLYVQATKALAGKPLVIENEKGGIQPNPATRVQDMYAKQMRDFAVKAGLSVDTRLKYASLKIKEEDDEIEDDFGDI